MNFEQNQKLNKEDYTLDEIAARVYKAYGLEPLPPQKLAEEAGNNVVLHMQNLHKPFEEYYSNGYINIKTEVSSKGSEVTQINFVHYLYKDVSEKSHDPKSSEFFVKPFGEYKLTLFNGYNNREEKQTIALHSTFIEKTANGWPSSVKSPNDDGKEWFFEKSGIAVGSMEFIAERIAMLEKKMSKKQAEKLQDRLRRKDPEVERTGIPNKYNGYNICPAFGG